MDEPQTLAIGNEARIQQLRSNLARRRRHLPEDLLPDILSRLPVKSLLRFRCVSKSWLSLVDDDADFARLHLNTFKNNRDETRLFVFEDWTDDEGVVRCSDTFEPISETPFGLFCDIVSSVDGLILLRSLDDDRLTYSKHRLTHLKLWNPSLRTFLDIPPPTKIGTALPCGGSPFLTDAEIGFGYDPLSKDYKIVKLLFESKTVLHSVAIYTVGVGSWKIIPFKGNGSSSCSEWYWRSSIKRNVYLKGSLYFIAKDEYHYRGRDLVSFDLSKEVFSVVVSKPHDDPYFMARKRMSLVVDGGSSLAVYNEYYLQGCFWVLDVEL